MGRRKIEIEFIKEDRSRATTFIKRKSGLFKKAHELAILTGAQIAVVVYSQQDRCFTYSSEACLGICKKFCAHPDTYESKGPADYGADDEESEDETPPKKDHVRSTSNGSISESPKIPIPKGLTPRQPSEFPSPNLKKRKLTPEFTGPPSREVSDLRNSPHQLPRPVASILPQFPHGYTPKYPAPSYNTHHPARQLPMAPPLTIPESDRNLPLLVPPRSSDEYGMGTNITIPRISTDMGSLFTNWHTGEGLSPATSMMLNQLQDGPPSAGAGLRGIAASLMNQSGGPPISAGVLENFSPVTRSWLQTFNNAATGNNNGLPPITTINPDDSPKDEVGS